MAVFKCKMCGGELNITTNETITVCPYCGTTQTIPFLDSDKKARLFNRANEYRLNNEFDKAYSSYEAIVNDDPEEAEAYWGLVLSEYGVEYVEDPKSKKRIPTCHRTRINSVTSNINYKKALEYADIENKTIYEDEAQELDKIQKKILSISSKEAPYDVFICYKESDENNQRTADSVLAQEIYDQLSKDGIKTFFARISLEDKIGQNYEPFIFNALNTAKVMLLVTSSNEYCDAVWVKNEWKRYLGMISEDNSKLLIPVLSNMSPYELPDELQKMQAQDMNKIGAMQDLIRGVKKVLGLTNSSNISGIDRDTLNELLKERENRKSLPAKIISSIVLAILFYIGCAITYNFTLFTYMGLKLKAYDLGLVNVILVLYIIVFILVEINIFKGMSNKIASYGYNFICIIGAIAFTVYYFKMKCQPNMIYILYLILAILTLVSNIFTWKKNKKALLASISLIFILSGISGFYLFNHIKKGQVRIEGTQQIEISINKVNIRNSANASSELLGVAYEGEIYTVLGKHDIDGDIWYFIDCYGDGKIRGYICGEFNKENYVKELN